MYFILYFLRGQRLSWLVILCLLGQELASTFSSYCFGLAGQRFSAGSGEICRVLIAGVLASPVSIFFEALAHLLGAWLFQKLYEDYYQIIFKKIRNQPSVLSPKNKAHVLSWVTGEAFLDLKELSMMFLGVVGSALNIFFSLFVFGDLLGQGAVAVIGLTALASMVLIFTTHQHLVRISENFQLHRSGYTRALRRVWDLMFFGGKGMEKRAFLLCQKSSKNYARSQNKSVILQGIWAVFPSTIGTLVLVVFLAQGWVGNSSDYYGALIPLLPKILDFFCEIQDFLGDMSRLIALNTRLKHLVELPEALASRPLLDRIKGRELAIIEVASGSIYPGSLEDFLEAIASKSFVPGRWKVVGPNGSGKSSFLLLVKQMQPEAWLLAPGIVLFPFRQDASAGEIQRYQIERLLKLKDPSIFLLDEWGANLDPDIRGALEKKISLAAQRHLIIEVRKNLSQNDEEL